MPVRLGVGRPVCPPTCMSAHWCADIQVSVSTYQCVCPESTCMCVGACVCEHLCLVHTRVSVWACVYCARIHSYRIVHAFTSVSAHVGACVTHACVQAEVMQGERAPVMAWVLCHSESAWLWDCPEVRREGREPLPNIIPFSSCPQSLSASGSFPMSQLFA